MVHLQQIGVTLTIDQAGTICLHEQGFKAAA